MHAFWRRQEQTSPELKTPGLPKEQHIRSHPLECDSDEVPPPLCWLCICSTEAAMLFIDLVVRRLAISLTVVGRICLLELRNPAILRYGLTHWTF